MKTSIKDLANLAIKDDKLMMVTISKIECPLTKKKNAIFPNFVGNDMVLDQRTSRPWNCLLTGLVGVLHSFSSCRKGKLLISETCLIDFDQRLMPSKEKASV